MPVWQRQEVQALLSEAARRDQITGTTAAGKGAEVSGYAQPFVIDAMRKAGLRPEYIHAYERVGHLITKSNRAVIPTEIVEAWDAAVEEYKQEHSEESTNG
jgi:hypothetical protein